MHIEEKIKDILCKLSGQENLESAMTLQGDLGLDSLSMIMMLVEIEDVFKIQLNESDLNPYDLNTIQNVIDMISKYWGDENE